jgi:hypothetical protein
VGEFISDRSTVGYADKIDARYAELIEEMVQAVGEEVEAVVTGQVVRATGSREIN